jgi:transcriptional regulator with XRE-family HTH domain
LSQRQLGELAGVSPGTIYRLEAELRGAYPVTVVKLASALGVSAEELQQEPRPAREEPEG